MKVRMQQLITHWTSMNEIKYLSTLIISWSPWPCL